MLDFVSIITKQLLMFQGGAGALEPSEAESGKLGVYWNYIKTRLSGLTDFQEFAIYDTRIKPSEKDTAATARIEYLTYDQLSENFESLYDKISWDAVDLGKFDTYYEGTKDKRGTATVDDDILNMIEKWRMVLAEDIALHNDGIDAFNLTGAVQKIIDRLLFLRICVGLVLCGSAACAGREEGAYLQGCGNARV